jgi:hypothetical protein
MAEQYSTVYMYHIFFIHSFVQGHLSWFYTFTVVNCALISMGVQWSVLYVTYISLGVCPILWVSGKLLENINK